MNVEIEGDLLGVPACHPRALLRVWLYGFLTRVRSCRKLEAARRDEIPYVWLTSQPGDPTRADIDVWAGSLREALGAAKAP